jgi:putative nucleotidyltransferase with HDIG domain
MKNFFVSLIIFALLSFAFISISVPHGKVLNDGWEETQTSELNSRFLFPLEINRVGEFSLVLSRKITKEEFEKYDSIFIPPNDAENLLLFFNGMLINGYFQDNFADELFPNLAVIPDYMVKDENEITVSITAENSFKIQSPIYLSVKNYEVFLISAMKYFYNETFIFVMAFFLIIGILLFYMGFSVKDRKKTYILFGFSLSIYALLAFLKLLSHSYLTTNFNTLMRVSDIIEIGASYIFLIAIEIYSVGEVKISKAILPIDIGLIIISAFIPENLILLFSLLNLSFIVYLTAKNKNPEIKSGVLLLVACVIFDALMNIYFFNSYIRFVGVLVLGIYFLVMIVEDYKCMLSEVKENARKANLYNAQLERSKENLQNILFKYDKLIASLELLFTDLDEKKFCERILQNTFFLIPEADYGAIAFLTDDEVEYIATVGHEIELLKKGKFRRESFYKMKKSAENKIGGRVWLFRNISSKSLARGSSLIKFLKPVKEIAIVDLMINGTLFGFMVIDIAESSDKHFSDDSLKILDAFGKILSSFIAFKKLIESENVIQRQIILSIIKMEELYDPYTRGHSENVANISSLIAEEMGFSADEIKEIYLCGLVHDIGKILLSKEILNKKEKLTEYEYSEMKKHPVLGADILNHSKELQKISRIVRYHHERVDGNGYPEGLKGDDIPVFSRILCVADSWDAMTGNRVYKEALAKEQAIKELEANSGTQFDSEVVKIMIKLIQEEKI